MIGSVIMAWPMMQMPAVALAVHRSRPSAMNTMPSINTMRTAENGPKYTTDGMTPRVDRIHKIPTTLGLYRAAFMVRYTSPTLHTESRLAPLQKAIRARGFPPSKSDSRIAPTGARTPNV